MTPPDDPEKDWRASLPFPAHWLGYIAIKLVVLALVTLVRASLLRIALMAVAEKIALRPALPADSPVLAEIFRASVEELGIEDYSESQVEAWSAVAEDEAAFAQKLAGALTLVALLRGNIVGFASLKGANVLDMIYVHPASPAKGVATQLCDALEKLAAARKAVILTADVSDSAQAFLPRAITSRCNVTWCFSATKCWETPP